MPVGASDSLFAGSMPEVYDRYLVPLIFESYARDLARRVATERTRSVLEIAAGAGVATRVMADLLPADVAITAADLNAPMVAHARPAAPPAPSPGKRRTP